MQDLQLSALVTRRSTGWRMTGYGNRFDGEAVFSPCCFNNVQIEFLCSTVPLFGRRVLIWLRWFRHLQTPFANREKPRLRTGDIHDNHLLHWTRFPCCPCNKIVVEILLTWLVLFDRVSSICSTRWSLWWAYRLNSNSEEIGGDVVRFWSWAYFHAFYGHSNLMEMDSKWFFCNGDFRVSDGDCEMENGGVGLFRH